MNLVDTPKPDQTRYARTPDGKIDFEAYKGLNGSITENGMTFDVKVLDARQRFGHLDFLCVPISGVGQRWIEYKNLTLRHDPAQYSKSGLTASAEYIVEYSKYGASS